MGEYKGVVGKEIDFEKMVREYIKQAQEKLEKDLMGTREAIKQLAVEKVKEFIGMNDVGLRREEREYLELVIISSMFQSFCYGYSIGKIEGKTSNRIFL